MKEEKKLKKSLEKYILRSDNIFILGHNNLDFDAIASAIGLQALSTFLGKKSYVVVDDLDLSAGVKKIVDDYRFKSNIINKEKFLTLNKKSSVLIMTDVNKNYLISLKDYLNTFKYILIIDHHKEDENTIAADYKYIVPNISSTSEIVTQLLMNYKNRIITNEMATFLLSGIILDTKRFRKNTTVDTMNAAKYLIKCGANMDYVEDLFFSEFEEDKRINNLVFSNTVFRTFEAGILTKNIAFTLNRDNPKTIYRIEDLAKAADKVIKYKVDAVFVLGYIRDNLLSISGRSKSDVDVSDILSNMKDVRGGGNALSAGAKAENIGLLELEDRLIKTTMEYLNGSHNNNDNYILKKTKKY